MAIKTYVAVYADGFSEDVFALDFHAAEDQAEARSTVFGHGGVDAVLGPRAIGRATRREAMRNVYL